MVFTWSALLEHERRESWKRDAGSVVSDSFNSFFFLLSLLAALSFNIPDRFQQIRPAEAIRNELIEFYLSLAKWNVCVVYDYPHSGSDGGRRKRRSIVLNAIKRLYSSVSFFRTN